MKTKSQERKTETGDRASGFDSAFFRFFYRASLSLLIVLFILPAVLSRPAWPLEIQAFPGSTWGELSYDHDDLVGAGTMGFIKQGITWYTFPGEITLDTFADARWRFRTENKEFYNAVSTGLGFEFNQRIFSLGVNYRWERFPQEAESTEKLQYYLKWFYDWNLMGEMKIRSIRTLHIEGFPGSTWGELSYDHDDLIGAGTMGFLKQGITWYTFPGEVTFDTFADARWRFRTENKEFYNAVSTGLGFEFNQRIFSLGVNYRWERFPQEAESSEKVQFYLRWYYDWDLKKV